MTITYGGTGNHTDLAYDGLGRTYLFKSTFPAHCQIRENLFGTAYNDANLVAQAVRLGTSHSELKSLALPISTPMIVSDLYMK